MNRVKSRILGLMSIPRRMWRSRGFGIHSPFAFDFITRTLYERAGFYAYELIDCESATPRIKNDARTVYRIALRLRHEKLSVTGKVHPLISKAAGLAFPEVPATTRRGTLLVVGADADIDGNTLAELLAGGGSVILTAPYEDNNQLLRFIIGQTDSGMVFTTRRLSVTTGAGRLPKQCFEI